LVAVNNDYIMYITFGTKLYQKRAYVLYMLMTVNMTTIPMFMVVSLQMLLPICVNWIIS